MTRVRFLSETESPVAATLPGSTAAPRARRSGIEQRLASAERELRLQFTRIAQLQAELDLLRAALQRSPDGARKR